jgi:glycerol-3-phosphate dehydrogenase
VDASISAATRSVSLAAMGGRPVDVLVVGGGITGAGVARDAAMRGFRTALVERSDFAAGTSGRSSRLIHGGLRYLEHGALRLVFEASRERRTLLRIAPHLVWPQPFLFPVFAGGRVPVWKLAAGLALYDALALLRNVKAHRWLSKRGLLRLEPGLRTGGLLGGARYYDAQCDDARLTLANVRAAHQAGALVANYVAVESFDVADGRVRGVRAVDAMAGERFGIRAHVVINATGPWSDGLRNDGRALLRPTKGAHVAVSRTRLGNRAAVTVLSPVDGRVMFVLPWGELTYIGTTDTDYTGKPEDAQVDAAEVVYLLRSANAVFPDARLQPSDVISTWAGVRPLLRPVDFRSPGAVSRQHQLVEDRGLISVVGGKLTTYRSMAAEVVDRAAAVLRALDGRPLPPRARTDREPLPGGETRNLELLTAELENEGLPRATAEYLVRLYGAEAPAVARLARSTPALARPVVPGHPALRAQLVHAIRREMALTLSDLLLRRTHIFFEVPGQALSHAPGLAELVGAELGWDAVRTASELAAYAAEAARHNAFRAGLAAGTG